MQRRTLPLYLYSFFMIMSIMVLFPLLPEIRAELGASYSEIAFFVASLGVVRMLLAIPSGFITDRYNKKKILVGSGLTAALGLIVIGTAQGLVQMVLGRAMIGMASILSTVSILVVLSGLAGPERRGVTISMNNVAHNAGGIIAPVLAGVLARSFQWRLPLFAVAALIVFGTAVLAFTYREDALPNEASRREKESSKAAHLSNSRNATLRLLFPVFALSLFVFFFRGSFRHTLLPLYGTDVLGIGVRELGLYLGFTSVIAMVSIFAFGFVADRFGRLAVLVPSLVMAAGAGAMLFLPLGANPFLFACMLLGLCSAINSMPNILLADRVEPAVMGRALGLNRVFADFGYFFGTVAVGAMLDRYGFALPIGVVSAYALVTLMMVLMFVKERKVVDGKDRTDGGRETNWS